MLPLEVYIRLLKIYHVEIATKGCIKAEHVIDDNKPLTTYQMLNHLGSLN